MQIFYIDFYKKWIVRVTFSGLINEDEYAPLKATVPVLSKKGGTHGRTGTVLTE